MQGVRLNRLDVSIEYERMDLLMVPAINQVFEPESISMPLYNKNVTALVFLQYHGSGLKTHRVYQWLTF